MPTTHRMLRNCWRLAGICGLLLCLGAAGCGDGDGADSAPVRQSVGATGGTLTSRDGALTLEIPAGALAADTEISIEAVDASALPDSLRAVTADRVYRLGPAGTQFALPVKATVQLDAGNQPAVMVLDSDGAAEWAGNLRTEINGSSRVATGELNHFSFLVTKSIDAFTATLSVDKRELLVGEEVNAQVVLSRRAVDDDGAVLCNWFNGPGPLQFIVPRAEACAPAEVFRQQPLTMQATAGWRCTQTGSAGVGVEYQLRLQGAYEDLPYLERLPRGLSTLNLVLTTDVVCSEAVAASGPRTGVQTLAGGTTPDGLRVHDGPLGLRMWLAVSQGLLAIDLLTGLIEHDLTASGLGAVGNANLDVATIARGTALAVFAASGTRSALRNQLAGNWGLTLLLLAPYLDASVYGNRQDAEEMVLTSPTAGIGFIRYDASSGFFVQAPGLSLSSLLFLGSLASAVMAFETQGSGVLALSSGTDGGTSSTVWWHDRVSNTAAAVPLFSIPDPLGRRLRCIRLPDGRALCVVTGQTLGRAWAFVVDPAAPRLPRTPVQLPVGAGPVGVQLSLGRDGLPVAVVANYADASLQLIRFDAAGQAIGNLRLPLPAGCSRAAHALLFVYQFSEWLAGTCPDENAYFVVPG